ncbi:MAG: NADH-quinone oxidoreductase subunit J [Candidatus Omnitrophica bacterium]|nr:NADH-quinone oxidoreductase subunit J [Candidatus Omnitrophota bacterium]MCM8816912.1 NADH-quinone oxidoreductase subunit J [Candidatus Omnitrophota bacterium]
MTSLLIGAVLVFACLAVFLKDMLKAVLCLLISSIFLAIIFFRLNAPFAGVFEISVVAGLIMVLFIITISIVGPQDTVSEPTVPIAIFLVLFMIFSYLVNDGIVHLLTSEKFLANSKDYKRFGEALWLGRTFDIVGQISVIFAGVFVVLLVAGRRRNGK